MSELPKSDELGPAPASDRQAQGVVPLMGKADSYQIPHLMAASSPGNPWNHFYTPSPTSERRQPGLMEPNLELGEIDWRQLRSDLLTVLLCLAAAALFIAWCYAKIHGA